MAHSVYKKVWGESFKNHVNTSQRCLTAMMRKNKLYIIKLSFFSELKQHTHCFTSSSKPAVVVESLDDTRFSLELFAISNKFHSPSDCLFLWLCAPQIRIEGGEEKKSVEEEMKWKKTCNYSCSSPFFLMTCKSNSHMKEAVITQTVL